jgi:histidinol-phosphate phosphatase family protein
MLLILVDRDGTIIDDMDFLGKNENWKSEIRYKPEVVGLIKYMQQHPSKSFVITNQGGVARKLYTCQTVEDIHSLLDEHLRSEGVVFDDWNYCPDVDTKYAELKKDIDFDMEYVKEKTKRKPSAGMVDEVLARNGLELSQFSKIVMLGDKDDDRGLAESVNGGFIDVVGKSYEELRDEFDSLIGK